MTTPEDARNGSTETVTVGVVADPVAAPAQIAEQFAHDLPRLLSEQLKDNCVWRVDVHREQLPPSDDRHTEMMDVAGERMRQHGWDLAACITELPLRSGGGARAGGGGGEGGGG